MSEIITYERLYEILRKEKFTAEVQLLEKEFYNNVVRYLGEKKKMVESKSGKSSFFAGEVQKIARELENIKRMVKELYERREQKIFQRALYASRSNAMEDISNFLPEEKEFFNQMLSLLDTYREGILKNLIRVQAPFINHSPPKDLKEIKEESNKSLSEVKEVRIINALPQFVGTDMNIYGPFEERETSTLPVEVADLLIKSERAEEIHVEVTKEGKEALSEM